jgi:hypothetical protein
MVRKCVYRGYLGSFSLISPVLKPFHVEIGRIPDIWDAPLPRFGHGTKVPYGRGGDYRTGDVTMTRLLNDILLFSCMAAFVTGIVIAAASLLS